MANPIEVVVLNSFTAANSFTTELAVFNYQKGSIQVVYGGMDTETGTINLRASNDPVVRTAPSSGKWSALNPSVITMVSACDNKFMNFPAIGFSWLQVQYNANSNTTGSIAIYATLKSDW